MHVILTHCRRRVCRPTQKNVIRLNVTVHNRLAVNVLYRTRNITDDGSNFLLRKTAAIFWFAQHLTVNKTATSAYLEILYVALVIFNGFYGPAS